MFVEEDAAHQIQSSMDLSTSFQELGLKAPLLRQLEKLQYQTPTPIQQACIPILLQKKDIMGLAQTGTGKTAAFALPLLQLLAEDRQQLRPHCVRALILSPTRELAAQIHDNIVAYGKGLDIRSAVVFGGVGYTPQEKLLARGLDILVATPGRLIDHLNRKMVNLNHVETFILDEADRMLDMGFAPDIRKITAVIPARRHTQLFSATMPDNIRKLAQSMLHQPETVVITPPTTTAEKVEQTICHVDTQAEKRETTLSLIRNREENGLTLLFTRTRHGASRLATFLSKQGHPASAIHGDKSQGARERMLREFRSGTTPILVATDIAARGIDVKDIDLVINYDIPLEPEVYIHRIGRTARAGASGTAISLCCPDEVKYASALQNMLGNPIPLHEDSKPAPAGMAMKQPRPERSAGRRSTRDNRHPSPSGRNNRRRSSRRRSA